MSSEIYGLNAQVLMTGAPSHLYGLNAQVLLTDEEITPPLKWLPLYIYHKGKWLPTVPEQKNIPEPVEGTKDHSELDNLDKDDHPQYSLADGTRPFTGPVSFLDDVSISGDLEVGGAPFPLFPSGTNANGSWIILPGGIQICWLFPHLVVAGGPTTWTFPRPFANTAIAVQATPRTNTSRFATTVNASVDSIDVRCFTDTGDSAVDTNVSMTAIGFAAPEEE